MVIAPVSAAVRGAMGNMYKPGWPWGVIDHVGPEYEPSVRPMDRLRAEGYPDDPEIADNPYRVGLFFGAPQLRCSGPAYFPAPAPVSPSVTFKTPASSSGASRFFPPGGDWQGVIDHFLEERDTDVGGGRRRGDDGLPHAWPDGVSGQGW